MFREAAAKEIGTIPTIQAKKAARLESDGPPPVFP